ncbi:RGCVC family protein [Lolliginicoccus suaedae]|uniref:RGCVC family protein n=1 Tax=Lolliginicoccus suaedae TaxID=2605429 RepID=UPI0011EDE2CB|nr:RGCVC family protein [Lolliginicoccus suaedae]
MSYMLAPTKAHATDTELAAAALPDTCDMCGHSDTTHDAIASRYCRATREHTLHRKCICPG